MPDTNMITTSTGTTVSLITRDVTDLIERESRR